MDTRVYRGISFVPPDKGRVPADTPGMRSGAVSLAGSCPGSHYGPACVMALMEVRE